MFATLVITPMFRRGAGRVLVQVSQRSLASTSVSTSSLGPIAQGQNKLLNLPQPLGLQRDIIQRHRSLKEPVLRSFAAATYKTRRFSHSTQTVPDSSLVVVDEDQLDSEGMPVKLGLEIPGIIVPPLPEIMDDAIREQVFTHRSVHARPTHMFEDEAGNPAPDNERFEHLGDAVLQLAVTQLLQDYYPCLRVGPATKIRSLAVGNGTLADIAMKYNLHQRLLLHHAQAITLKNSVHIRADVFEAYVGGLFLDQGLEVVKEWLYVLFEPYIREAYRIVRNQHGLPPVEGRPVYPSSPSCDQNGHMMHNWPSPPSPNSPPACQWSSSGGHLSLFNQKMQQNHKAIEWKYTSDRGPGTKTTPIWRVQAMLDGQCVAEGRGSTKKAAQNDAAKTGLAGLDEGANEGSPRA